jgi:hypothetical protein
MIGNVLLIRLFNSQINTKEVGKHVKNWICLE